MRPEGVARFAPLGVLACLLPLWAVGLFGRGFYTPDEPREADLAWRMSFQAEKAVPQLAGETFCEKPPLTYWAAGAAIAVFGSSASAARLPNLLYAAIAALALGGLAFRAAGHRAAWLAPLVGATFLMSYQVSIWLATDAPLVAGVSVALYGLWRGFVATRSRERLIGYSVMHLGLALGFLSKSMIAWGIVGLTLLAMVIWERRWRELARWELYAGLILQAALIGPWIWSVYHGPHGLDNLRVFFWNNLAGRLAHIDAPAALRYSEGHRNSLGKYILEWPSYVFPWTFWFAAAVRRAWRRVREPVDVRRVWRFALAVMLPSVLVLSFASTARGIYVAPLLPGAALLIALWASELPQATDRFDRWMLRGTVGLLIGFFLLLAFALLPLRAAAIAQGSHSAWWLALAVAAIVAGICIVGLGRSIAACLAAYLLVMSLSASYVFHVINAWQDLPQIARLVRQDVGTAPLILWKPDETTRAVIDMHARLEPMIVRAEDPQGESQLRDWLRARPTARVLMLEPVRAGGAASDWLRAHGLGHQGPSPAPALPAWAQGAALEVIARYELPHGRRYALLAHDGE